MTEIVTDAGASAKIKLYDGVQPLAGGAPPAGTLLAVCVAGATMGTVSGGVLTFDPIASDPAAAASGTPTWVRITRSDDTTWIADIPSGFVGAVTAAQPYGISSITITEGNG